MRTAICSPIETSLIAAILAEFGAHPDLVLWRSNTGAARSRRSGRVVRFGVVGCADISGVMRVTHQCVDPRGVLNVVPVTLGRAVFIEAKSARGRQSEAQGAFQDAVVQRGALYVLARSIHDVRAALRKEGLRP